jgi:kumamolisin
MVTVKKFALIVLWMLIVSIAVFAIVTKFALADTGTATIQNETLPVLRSAQLVSRASRYRPMKLLVGLQLHNRAGLDKLMVELYDPSAPNYRHFLTPQEFAERFTPPRREYLQVARYLRAHAREDDLTN